MLIVTTPTISGYKIVESLGLVRGSTTRARFIGRDLVAGLRMIAGGEVKEYTKLLAESREQALQRMIADANSLGADAVVNVRFTTSAITSTAAEILAFGTAVTLEDAPK